MNKINAHKFKIKIYKYIKIDNKRNYKITKKNNIHR